MEVMDSPASDLASDRASNLEGVMQILPCATPDAWIEAALDNLDVLLVDHANCEKKAASTALSLIYRYIEHPDLLNKLSKLAREELRHFEQVMQIMKRRKVAYVHVSACSYAGELRKLICPAEPHRLVDTLIACALIEARSCERFAKLCQYLDDDLRSFYGSLLKSEARHFEDYLKFAKQFAKKFGQDDISSDIERFAIREKALIEMPSRDFRFHSGPPA